jgi:hypothetical protein
MSSRDADSDEIGVRLTMRQLMIVIAVIGTALGLLIQVPFLVVAGLDAILLGFAFYKVVLLPRRVRFAVLTVIAVVMLGIIIGLLHPIVVK